jgi:diaminopimelate epimerase
MGNPHAVLFIKEDPVNYLLETIGPVVENHSLFPNRVNFEVCQILDRQHVKQRTWERGVGETLACGTGACAVAVAAQLKGLVDRRVTNYLIGGTLQLEWDGQGEVFMTGPAEIVFKGDWPE